MPVAWYLVPFRRSNPGQTPPRRELVIVDHAQALRAEGGAMTSSEVLGDHGLVKVRASGSMLNTIAATAGVTRFKHVNLDDPLADLTDAEAASVKARALALGYVEAEWAAAFPNPLQTYTLRDLLAFVSQRRLTPRYDVATDAVVLNGAPKTPPPPDTLDAAIQG